MTGPRLPVLPTGAIPLRSATCTMCKRSFDPSRVGALVEVIAEGHGTAAHCCSVICLLRWLAVYQTARPITAPSV